MSVRKAVIPAAGWGTRFLPASKAVPKELIPVVDRPVIQYAVEELVRAGISEIYIVISPGKESVAGHFKPNPGLEAALQKSGKTDLLRLVRDLQEMASVHSVVQEQALGLGHAVWVAKAQIGDEPFVVALPDELFDPAGDYVSDMIKAFETEQASVTAVTPVPHEEIRAYGAIAAQEADLASGGPLIKVTGVVEKPDPAEAPSDLALCGRYVLGPEVFSILEQLPPGAGGEIQLADALGSLARMGRLRALRYEGRRWDVGTRLGYLEAVVTLSLEHPKLGPDFARFLSELSLPSSIGV